MRPGPLNLITDVTGLLVGNAENDAIKTGVTVLTGVKPFVAGVAVMGGAPGTRETDLLAPDKLVAKVDALVLSGGSALGLAAAQGVADAMRQTGRGFAIGDQRVPIVPAAIIFDLINGGDKSWLENPYPELGRQALDNADEQFAIGSAGAGAGALSAGLKGGLGSASLMLENATAVGALAAVNPTGSVTMGKSPHFWANPFEIGDEFGGLGPVATPLSYAETRFTKGEAFAQMANTTIAIVATDLALDKAQATRMATAAHDGIGRAISPAHTPIDGDLIFALSTGARPIEDAQQDLLGIGHAAAICLSRAIARAIYEASPAPGDLFPTWRQLFGA